MTVYPCGLAVEECVIPYLAYAAAYLYLLQRRGSVEGVVMELRHVGGNLKARYLLAIGMAHRRRPPQVVRIVQGVGIGVVELDVAPVVQPRHCHLLQPGTSAKGRTADGHHVLPRTVHHHTLQARGPIERISVDISNARGNGQRLKQR